MEKLYNVSETAKILGLSVSCVYKKAESGKLEAVKLGSALRFTESGIQAFIENGKISKQSETPSGIPGFHQFHLG